jgi:hypothetical protein
MIVTTFKHYQARACDGGTPDAGYWNRVFEWLRSEAQPEGWDEEGQPLYSITDLVHAEDAAKARLH